MLSTIDGHRMFVSGRRSKSRQGEASAYQSTSARLQSADVILTRVLSIAVRMTASIVATLADSPSVDKFIQFRSYCTSATMKTIVRLCSLGRTAVAMDNSVLDTVVLTVSMQLGFVVVIHQLVDNLSTTII